MRSVTEHCSRWLFLFFADAVLLCFATWSLQIAVEWLRQGVSKGACSPVLSCDWFVFCKSFLALELLHEWRVLNVRIYAKHYVFPVYADSVAEKSWLACATVTEGSRWLFLFFVDAVLLCFATPPLQIAVEWLRPGVSKGPCSPVLSCDWFVFCKSFLADRIGTATWMMCFECSDFRKTLCFPGLRRFRCGEKLARVRDRVKRRRFAVGSCSICARSVTEGSRCSRCASFYCALQLCFGGSQWNGCVKVPRCCGCVLTTNVFCSWRVVNRIGLAASRVRWWFGSYFFSISGLLIFLLKFHI